MKGNTLKKTKCKNIVCCATRLQGAIVGNLPPGTLKRLLINLAACIHHWDTDYFRPPVMPERWKCRLPKQDRMEWVTNQIFLSGRCLQGLHNSQLPILLLGKQLSLPFVSAKRGGFPWAMRARLPFLTLKELLSVRHGADWTHVKKPHLLQGIWWESGGKCASCCCDPKSKLLRSLLGQNDKHFSKTTLPPGHQV